MGKNKKIFLLAIFFFSIFFLGNGFALAAETEAVVKTLPIIGQIDIKGVSLPLISALIGIVDGFNPCAMWILLFLISMLIGMNDRRRMWIIGVTFITTSAIVYFLIMMSWMELSSLASNIVWIRNGIAFIAIIGGFINLKSYKNKVDGCEIVDDEKRNRIFGRIKKFTTEKSLFLALLGVITLAVTVNVIELACSAGLPLLFSQVLVVNEVTFNQKLIYTLIYIFFFLLDDLIVFAIAMKTMQLTGFSTKYSKYSHLIGGILMLIIGSLLILKPEWIMFNF